MDSDGPGDGELLYLNDEPWKEIVPATLEGADEEKNVGQDAGQELSGGTGVHQPREGAR